MNHILWALISAWIVVGVPAANAGTLAGPITNPANGHDYYLLDTPTWTASQAEAQRLGGHLATVNDSEENQWISSTFFPLTPGARCELWIGLNDAASKGQWVWASGEPVNFTYWWGGGLPGSAWVGQHFAVIRHPAESPPAGSWNATADQSPPSYPKFGIVETSRKFVHGARGSAQIVNGFVVAATLTDPGYGYTNPPVVRFVGGGGTGASATTTVSNGIVTGITMEIAGRGYTSVPLVRIASPSKPPEVGIRVLKVAVEMRVILGNRYQLLVSGDLAAWNESGSPFIAEDELITRDFEINDEQRFFRLVQVQ